MGKAMGQADLINKTQITVTLSTRVIEAMDVRAAAERLRRTAWLNKLLGQRLIDEAGPARDGERE